MRNISKTLLPLTITLLHFVNHGFTLTKDEEDLILSPPQKETLQRFKEKVSSLLPYDYMRKDIFLLRWLRSQNFDISQATERLKQNLKWREESKIDSLDEDWSHFELEYPILPYTSDTYGRPTAVINIGEWDIRQASISGKSDKLALWLIKLFEGAEIKVRDLQDQGQNITRWNLLVNLNQFSVQSVCLQCLPFYATAATAFELNYSPGLNKVIIVNTPRIFEVALNLIFTFLSASSKESIKYYGTNQAEWKPIILEDFEQDKLPREFGGNIID